MKGSVEFDGTDGVEKDILECLKKKYGKIDSGIFEYDGWNEDSFFFIPVKNEEKGITQHEPTTADATSSTLLLPQSTSGRRQAGETAQQIRTEQPQEKVAKVRWDDEIFREIPNFLLKIIEHFYDERDLPYGKYNKEMKAIVPIPIAEISEHRSRPGHFPNLPTKWKNSEGWSEIEVTHPLDSASKNTRNSLKYSYFVDRIHMPRNFSNDSKNIGDLLEKYGNFSQNSVTSYIVQRLGDGQFSLAPRIAQKEQTAILASDLAALTEHDINHILNRQLMVTAKVINAGFGQVPQSTGTSRVNVPCLTTNMIDCIAVALVGEKSEAAADGKAKIRLFHVYPFNDKTETSIKQKIQEFRTEGLRVRAAMLGGRDSKNSKKMALELRAIFKKEKVKIEFDRTCKLRSNDDIVLGCVVLPDGGVQFIKTVMAGDGNDQNREDGGSSIDDNRSESDTKYEPPPKWRRDKDGGRLRADPPQVDRSGR